MVGGGAESSVVAVLAVKRKDRKTYDTKEHMRAD